MAESMMGKMVRVLTLQGMAHYTTNAGLQVGDVGKVVMDALENGDLLGVQFEGKPFSWALGEPDAAEDWFAFQGDEVEAV